jgi:hypothetical protein
MGDGQHRAAQTSATHSKVRPCSSCCSYCRCRSVRALDGAARALVPMESRSALASCSAAQHFHKHTHTHALTHTHTLIRTHTHTHTHQHTHTHTHTRTHTVSHTHARAHTHIVAHTKGIYASMCRSSYLSIQLAMIIFVYLFFHLFFPLSIYPSIYSSIYLSIYPGLQRCAAALQHGLHCRRTALRWNAAQGATAPHDRAGVLASFQPSRRVLPTL